MQDLFWRYVCLKNFPKCGICEGTKQIIEIFIIDQIQWKLMSEFSNKFKKPFLAHFEPTFQFWGEKKISQKIWLSHTTSHGILAPCQNLEKINDTFLRKYPDRWKDWRTDRTDRPYFIGPFRLLPRVQIYVEPLACLNSIPRGNKKARNYGSFSETYSQIPICHTRHFCCIAYFLC